VSVSRWALGSFWLCWLSAGCALSFRKVPTYLESGRLHEAVCAVAAEHSHVPRHQNPPELAQAIAEVGKRVAERLHAEHRITQVSAAELERSLGPVGPRLAEQYAILQTELRHQPDRLLRLETIEVSWYGLNPGPDSRKWFFCGSGPTDMATVTLESTPASGSGGSGAASSHSGPLAGWERTPLGVVPWLTRLLHGATLGWFPNPFGSAPAPSSSPPDPARTSPPSEEELEKQAPLAVKLHRELLAPREFLAAGALQGSRRSKILRRPLEEAAAPIQLHLLLVITSRESEDAAPCRLPLRLHLSFAEPLPLSQRIEGRFHGQHRPLAELLQ
jgi:hypothetical protein